MNTPALASIVILVSVGLNSIASANNQPVFRSVGDAIEEIIVSVLSSTLEGEEPRSFSVGLIDHVSMPPAQDHLPLSPNVLAGLSKRLPERWADYIDLADVTFVTWGKPNNDHPDLILPQVPHDRKKRPISFIRIKGVQYIDDSRIKVSWECTTGSPSGVGGITTVTWTDESWKLTDLEVYHFD